MIIITRAITGYRELRSLVKKALDVLCVVRKLRKYAGVLGTFLDQILLLVLGAMAILFSPRFHILLKTYSAKEDDRFDS